MLNVNLTGNGTGFQQMLNSARAQAKAFSNSVEHEVSSSWGTIGKSFAGALAGMFTIEGLKGSIEHFVETGKEIKETSEQVDMSAESWQKWTDAVDRAGLSTQGFMRIVETLRQKRTDALTDPKARAELSRLGFSDADITGNMDMSEFTKRALENANGGDLQRGYLSDVIGNRGLKYATAVPKLKDAQAAYSDEDLKNADDLATGEKNVSRAVDKATVKVARFFTDRNYQTGALAGLGAIATGALKLGMNPLMWKSAIKDFENAGPTFDKVSKGGLGGYTPAVAMRDGKPITAVVGPDGKPVGGGEVQGPPKPEKDPFDAKLAQQREELALHEQDRQQRLIDSQRNLMTIGDRRASILGEMPGLQKQISDRNAKMGGEGFLTDAQKDELNGVTGKAREFSVNALRTKFQDETDNLQLRYNKDKGDLKEKPLNFSTDSMSKVGLYSASNVAFNPLVAGQQRANTLLEKIVVNTTPKSNPMDRNNKIKDPHNP